MDFNERLKMLLNKENMTAKELTEKLGIGKTTVNDWKREKSTPSPKVLIGISHIFKVSIDWLLTGEENYINKTLITISDDKEILLKNWDKLSERQKGKAEYFIEQMIEENIKTQNEEMKIS